MHNFTNNLLEVTKAAASHMAAAKSGSNPFDHSMSVNSAHTIFLADLPKSITYLELSEYFQQNVGACQIKITR